MLWSSEGNDEEKTKCSAVLRSSWQELGMLVSTLFLVRVNNSLHDCLCGCYHENFPLDTMNDWFIYSHLLRRMRQLWNESKGEQIRVENMGAEIEFLSMQKTIFKLKWHLLPLLPLLLFSLLLLPLQLIVGLYTNPETNFMNVIDSVPW